ncbi:MAG TPA: archease [Thermoanaerobaculales bacterium]|nr:archease [Thermoanaerobaculales bacterium]HPA82025.1 archease [Thermoanaerobaculales bacterium]HQL30155.1 archease [Thermoanaerobaculales bacterium]HQP44404.1 archease [Thermoanaerobaculales bacterium]
MQARQGHRELGHTADWALEVWAPDLATLLAEAAIGMYRLMGVVRADGPRQRRRLELEGADRESLLVEFLAELLYLAESEGLAFDVLELVAAEGRLEARLEGAPIGSQTKEIKAVTYHKLEVRDTDQGLETCIVFDV